MQLRSSDRGCLDLAAVRARAEEFDVVMLTAVWLHFDALQRRQAMPNVLGFGTQRRRRDYLTAARVSAAGTAHVRGSAEETIAPAQPLRSPLYAESGRGTVTAAARRQLGRASHSKRRRRCDHLRVLGETDRLQPKITT